MEIMLVYEGRSGSLEHNGDSYPIAAFGGACPDVGDRILDPGATPRDHKEKIDFDDPQRRNFWIVKERIFVPDATPPRCFVVVQSTQATEREAMVLL